MIYALNTRDVSDHERRQIARQIRDGQDDILSQDDRVALARDARVGKGIYYCIYCMSEVHKFYPQGKSIIFRHQEGGGCVGSDKGLPGIVNPPGATIPGQS